MALILNPDSEIVAMAREQVEENDGYCPCQFERSADTLCPCRYLREHKECLCGLYVNTDDM